MHDISAHLIEWSNFHITCVYLPARYKFISMETIWKPLKPDYHILNSCSSRAIPNTCYSLKNFVIPLHISAFPEETRPFTLYETIMRNNDTILSLYRNSKKEENIHLAKITQRLSETRRDIFLHISLEEIHNPYIQSKKKEKLPASIQNNPRSNSFDQPQKRLNKFLGDYSCN